MKRFVYPLLATVLGGLFAAFLINQTKTVRLEPMKGRANIVEAERDPELAAAVLRARKELPRFIAALAKPDKMQSDFAVNARFQTPRGPEQIWVTVDRFEGGVFEGRLADDPVAIPNMKKGDPVKVPENVVNDWVFRNDGKIAGGYTMQVLLQRAGKKN